MGVPEESQAKRRIRREETMPGIPFRGWVTPVCLLPTGEAQATSDLANLLVMVGRVPFNLDLKTNSPPTFFFATLLHHMFP